ncbi:hypothetical protein L1987_19148 [Smallanthus sonchifolius]|uniref:Uncharacterized protein n=1 Tax=Smallanthus sonchifolius TaxID=185202 RepID=A0ACB9J259_9ASTR|nr:hypothetical protein L1987_19148 [Smallanthus sonchifolius]
MVPDLKTSSKSLKARSIGDFGYAPSARMVSVLAISKPFNAFLTGFEGIRSRLMRLQTIKHLELAIQIAEQFEALGWILGVKCVVLV